MFDVVSTLATNANLAFIKVSKEFSKSRVSGVDAHGGPFAQGRQPSYPSGTDTAEVRSEMNAIISR